MNSIEGNETINEENALILLLDYNVERSTKFGATRNIQDAKSSDLRFLSRYNKKKKSTDGAKIHLDTLEEYSHDGGGRYELSAVKLLKTTLNFDKYSDQKTGCQKSQIYVQCYDEILVNYTKMQCGCAPFHLMSLHEFEKVRMELTI